MACEPVRRFSSARKNSWKFTTHSSNCQGISLCAIGTICEALIGCQKLSGAYVWHALCTAARLTGHAHKWCRQTDREVDGWMARAMTWRLSPVVQFVSAADIDSDWKTLISMCNVCNSLMQQQSERWKKEEEEGSCCWKWSSFSKVGSAFCSLN